MQIRNLHALLFPGIAIAHGDSFVFQRLMIDGNTEGRADLVLPRVKLSDSAGVVVDRAQRRLQRTLDRLRQPTISGLFFASGKNRGFDRRQLGCSFRMTRVSPLSFVFSE